MTEQEFLSRFAARVGELVKLRGLPFGKSPGEYASTAGPVYWRDRFPEGLSPEECAKKMLVNGISGPNVYAKRSLPRSCERGARQRDTIKTGPLGNGIGSLEQSKAEAVPCIKENHAEDGALKTGVSASSHLYPFRARTAR